MDARRTTLSDQDRVDRQQTASAQTPEEARTQRRGTYPKRIAAAHSTNMHTVIRCNHRPQAAAQASPSSTTRPRQ